MSVIYNYNNIKIAVIGCGNWGKNLIRNLHRLGALAAVCDTDQNKAAAFSDQYQIPSLSLAEILKDSTIQGVMVATPSNTHFDIGLQALSAKKHLFMEKPLTLQVKNALTLQSLAKKENCLLMVGHLLLYHQAFNTLKKIKQEGTFGDLRYIYSNRFNFGKFPGEESVLWDYAPHDVSMILSLVDDMPLSVSGKGFNHLSHTTMDTVSIALNFANNIHGQIAVSWLHPFKEQKLVVVGSKAMAVFDDLQPLDKKLCLYPYPEQWCDGLPQPFPPQPQPLSLDAQEPLFNECRHFLDCIDQKKEPLTHGLDGIKVIAILEAAALSMGLGHAVEPNISKQTDTIQSQRILENA